MPTIDFKKYGTPISSPIRGSIDFSKYGTPVEISELDSAEPEQDGFLKSLVKAPTTILARPFQAVAALGGVSDEAIDKFSREKLGGFVAPTPDTFGDVKKDVGRGVQTVAFGMPGLASAGAAFGLGSSLEKGNDLFSAQTAFDIALGIGTAKVSGFVGKPLLNAAGKVVGKVTPEVLKEVAKQGTKAIQNFASKHQILPAPLSKAVNVGAQKIENIANKPFELGSKAGSKAVDLFKGNVQKSLEKDVDNLLTKTKGIISKTQLGQRKNVDYKKIMSEPEVFKGLKVKDGKINPDEAIQVVKNRKDLLLDAKRTLLPEVDRFTPKVAKEVIRQKAIQNIRGKYTPADEKDLIRAINKQVNAMPDEMTATEIDGFRARFRSSARNAQGLQKSSSEYTSLENATRDTVFDITDNLPFDTNKEYQAINNTIKDLISTEEFLDKTIRGQIVKGGRLTNLLGRGIGAIAGSKFGVLGTLGGSEVGGAVANIITNNQLGSSVKMKLIKEITNDPAILKQATDFLLKTQRYTPPLLPRGGEVRKHFVGRETIFMPSRKAIEQGTEIVPRNQSSQGILTKPSPRSNIQTTIKTTAPIPISPTLPQTKGKVNPLGMKVKSNNSLAQEARKYKSAEDFVDSQTKEISSKARSENPTVSKYNYERTSLPIENIKEFETVDLKSPKFQEIKRSVSRGDRTPIIVDERNRIIDGHHRFNAYKESGANYGSVPVLKVIGPGEGKIIRDANYFDSKIGGSLTDFYNKAVGKVNPLLPNVKLQELKNNLMTSGSEYLKLIDSGDLSRADFLRSDGTPKPQFMEHIISDLSEKLNGYSKGLGAKFKKVVNPSTNMDDLINQAVKFVDKLGGNVK